MSNCNLLDNDVLHCIIRVCRFETFVAYSVPLQLADFVNTSEEVLQQHVRAAMNRTDVISMMGRGSTLCDVEQKGFPPACESV